MLHFFFVAPPSSSVIHAVGKPPLTRHLSSQSLHALCLQLAGATQNHRQHRTNAHQHLRQPSLMEHETLKCASAPVLAPHLLPCRNRRADAATTRNHHIRTCACQKMQPPLLYHRSSRASSSPCITLGSPWLNLDLCGNVHRSTMLEREVATLDPSMVAPP